MARLCFQECILKYARSFDKELTIKGAGDAGCRRQGLIDWGCHSAFYFNKKKKKMCYLDTFFNLFLKNFYESRRVMSFFAKKKKCKINGFYCLNAEAYSRI